MGSPIWPPRSPLPISDGWGTGFQVPPLTQDSVTENCRKDVACIGADPDRAGSIERAIWLRRPLLPGRRTQETGQPVAASAAAPVVKFRRPAVEGRWSRRELATGSFAVGFAELSAGQRRNFPFHEWINCIDPTRAFPAYGKRRFPGVRTPTGATQPNLYRYCPIFVLIAAAKLCLVFRLDLG